MCSTHRGSYAVCQNILFGWKSESDINCYIKGLPYNCPSSHSVFHVLGLTVSLTNYLTYFKELSPSWEHISHSSSQEIFRFLWNPKLQYCAHKSLSLIPILRQLNPVHNFPPYFPTVHSNIIFPPRPRSFEWSFPFRFSDQNFLLISPYSFMCELFPFQFLITAHSVKKIISVSWIIWDVISPNVCVRNTTSGIHPSA